MSTKRIQPENLGEAVSVLVQTAELAQKSGILTLDDAVIVKSSIDFIISMTQQNVETVEPSEELDGPTL